MTNSEESRENSIVVEYRAVEIEIGKIWFLIVSSFLLLLLKY